MAREVNEKTKLRIEIKTKPKMKKKNKTEKRTSALKINSGVIDCKISCQT